jgi:hypothetical protein
MFCWNLICFIKLWFGCDIRCDLTIVYIIYMLLGHISEPEQYTFCLTGLSANNSAYLSITKVQF